MARFHRLTLALIAGGLLGLAGCSGIYDFDTIEDLPCDCLPGYVCLPRSNTCVKAGSSELGRACDLSADSPDDLCPSGSVCQDVRGEGAHCRKACQGVSYNLVSAAAFEQTQCGTGQLCTVGNGNKAKIARGVCAESECNSLAQTGCQGGQRCVDINGAGRCMTACHVTRDALLGNCSEGFACQPVVLGSSGSPGLACLPVGTSPFKAACGFDPAGVASAKPCAQKAETGEALICSQPSPNAPPLCHQLCIQGAGHCPNGVPCQVRYTDSNAGLRLGVCPL